MDREKEKQFDIDPTNYAWTIKAFSTLKSRLGVKIRLHQKEGLIEAGQIFLFNHFARFETFIPQYLIYQESGAYSRGLASAEFFRGDDFFSNFLRSVGAVPNRFPGLLPFLAKEILHGRKMIIFPEGGMVKDKRVVDSKGEYSIYSRHAKERRKHHSGAAVLALNLGAFKGALRDIEKEGNRPCLQKWADSLDFASIEELMLAVRQPTLIVPANITFYPIRVTDNVLRKGVELFSGGLSKRFSEELLIEGNILLKETDMDLRLGNPIRTDDSWNWWERRIISRLVCRVDSLDELFAIKANKGKWADRMVAKSIGRTTIATRDDYMREMYAGVTLNLSHLASRLMMMYMEKGWTEIGRDLFHKALYLAIKNAQKDGTLALHDSVTNPVTYRGVIDGHCQGLEQFISAAVDSKLVEVDSESYRFLPKLVEEQEFDAVRLENIVVVYANEMTPVAAAKKTLEEAIAAAPSIDDRKIARLLFDDELVSFATDRKRFRKRKHEEINRQETATESGEPYLIVPKRKNGLGVVLVHGFLASPAELRAFGEKLVAAGYPVIGVRLKGHGTSPWDLRTRSWRDWLESVRRGYRIMKAFTDQICVIGFSSGGALALILAAEKPDKLAGVAVVSTPLKFRNKNLIFVPLVHGANVLTRWMSTYEGVFPFRLNESEHPQINYRHIPIRGLFEVRRMVDELDNRLSDVNAPALVIQGTDDHVVDRKSADLIHRKLGSRSKALHMIEASRHGILNENVGDTQAKLLSFVASLKS
jgi:esterase/lipase/1-acyl-sn-glycerol-3-phosphate acyltransferase